MIGFLPKAIEHRGVCKTQVKQGGGDKGDEDGGDLQDLPEPAPHGPDDEEEQQDSEDDAVEWVQAEHLAVSEG